MSECVEAGEASDAINVQLQRQLSFNTLDKHCHQSTKLAALFSVTLLYAHRLSFRPSLRNRHATELSGWQTDQFLVAETGQSATRLSSETIINRG